MALDGFMYRKSDPPMSEPHFDQVNRIQDGSSLDAQLGSNPLLFSKNL
jgi:hypothetical protein